MKKKQALDNLFKTGKISEATRDSFENDINAVIMEIEKQQKDLSVKMQGKMQELESQIKTLETLLANYEIQHVIGEIDEESYQREITLLSTGLETAKRELTAIKDAINQLCSPVAATVTEPSPTETIETTPNTPVEDKAESSAEAEIIAAPIPEETVVTTEQAVPEQQPEIVSEEAVPVEIVQTAESASKPVVETPAPIENHPIIADASPQQTEPITEAVEETQEVAEAVSQKIENPAQEIIVEPEITEETVTVKEDSLDVTEHPQDVTEEVLQVIESSPEIVEEIVDKAHPQKAPEEAHQEVTVEGTSDQEQVIEEMAATADTEENTETEET